MFRPAMVGAEPCTGSNRPARPPMLADGRSPSDPTTAPASSERMSPNKLPDSTTSKCFGFVASNSAHESDVLVLERDVRISRPHLGDHLTPEPRGLEHVGLVDRGHEPTTGHGAAERDLGNPLDLRTRVTHGVKCRTGHLQPHRGALRSIGLRLAHARSACQRQPRSRV